MKEIIQPNTMKNLYWREKNFKEILSPFLFPCKAKQIDNSITSCDKYDICKNFLVSDTKFKCKVTGRVYNIRVKLTCNSTNVVYWISSSNCDDLYVGSVLDFKSRFRIHKSDIKSKKDRCGTASHFNTECTDISNSHKFLKIQIIESVQCDYNLEGKLWERGRYWQCQLFTNTYGMNSASDLYSTKRKGSRKK